MDFYTSEGRSAPSPRKQSRTGRAFAPLDLDSQTAMRLQAFGERYRLTMAEQRLVLVLREGKGLKAAARRIGVGYETVRTQIKSVFMKTGAKRQADVMSIFSSFGES